MKLSELVFHCVKNVIYRDDTSFYYENFLEGNFNDDVDYAANIFNAFAPINEAIARLSDLERIPYRVEECNIVDNIIDLNKCKYPVKEVVGVAENSWQGLQVVEHRPFGLGKVYIPNYNNYAETFIEYKEDIPYFSNLDYSYTKNSNYELKEITDVNLRDYGISDSMCNYIIEYVMGRLYEPISAEIANMHISRSEQYFNGIRHASSAFVQKQVKNVFSVGE